VRSRVYLEDGLCRLELKTKDPRGLTVKKARTESAASFGVITGGGRQFLAERFADERLEVPVGALRPGVRIDYARATLCDLAGGTRVTVDGGLVASLGRRYVRIAQDHVLVETKGGLRPRAPRRPARVGEQVRRLAVAPAARAARGALAPDGAHALPGRQLLTCAPWRTHVA
jgi:hypothetical protein